MLLHMPFVIALAAVTIFLNRKSALKSSHALACGAFGFYLADTSLAAARTLVASGLRSLPWEGLKLAHGEPAIPTTQIPA